MERTQVQCHLLAQSLTQNSIQAMGTLITVKLFVFINKKQKINLQQILHKTGNGTVSK